MVGGRGGTGGIRRDRCRGRGRGRFGLRNQREGIEGVGARGRLGGAQGRVSLIKLAGADVGENIASQGDTYVYLAWYLRARLSAQTSVIPSPFFSDYLGI